MPSISYLNGKRWSDITREERVFCAALHYKVLNDPATFARWVIRKAHLPIESTVDWDIGYEVCLYRDLLFDSGFGVKPSKFSPKRTFDLCLFSERNIIVIEAKAFQCFGSKEAAYYQRDRAEIKKLLKQDIDVQLVALASSHRVNLAVWQDRPKALAPFDGFITWRDINERYPDPLFARAEELCRTGPGARRARVELV